jgi:putative thioredoxin
MEIVHGGVEAAFSRLLELVKNSSGDDRKLAKEHLLSLFALVDPADPRLSAARTALANAIF